MHPYSVILRPIVSEKSNETREAHGKYTFLVRRDATKHDVRRAVERLWNVKVAGVCTILTRGKVKRRGQQVYKASNQKKAIVTLAEGAKLPLFDEQ